MTDVNVKLSGQVVYWSLTEFTDRSTLLTEWGGLGLADLVPDQREPLSVLKSALHSVFKGTKTLIRPLDKKDGYVVVSEDRGQDENRYESGLAAKWDGKIVFNRDHPRQSEVIQAFGEHFGRLDNAQVATALVKLVAKLQGVNLRPGSGGVYFVPGDKAPLWKDATAALEKAAAGGSHHCYRIHHEIDEEGVRAVKAALEAEVSREVDEIRRDVIEGELGERALRSRSEQAKRLNGKISQYEGLLGETLAKLKEAVEETDCLAFTAAMSVGKEHYVN